jgi:hypothetical protein
MIDPKVVIEFKQQNLKAYRGNGGKAPYILKLESRKNVPASLIPKERNRGAAWAGV